MHFGRKNRNIKYFIDKVELGSRDMTKDLGVIIDNKLKFKTQVFTIKRKCYKFINMIFKIFHVRDVDFYCKLFNIYVLSVIFYASPIYFTGDVVNMNELEKIQKYFTRRLFFRINGKALRPNYNYRLKLFGLQTLESSCVKSDLLMLYKLLYELIESSFKPIFSTRKPTRIIFQTTVSKTCRASFFHRSLVLWNKYVSQKFDSMPINYDAFLSFLSTNQSCFSFR